MLVESTFFPYHITNRSNNKEFFYLPVEELWSLCVENIKKVKEYYQIETHAFVLMSNHFHWVLSTPSLHLSKSMNDFHRNVARQANQKAGRMNHFWGGRYRWSLINNELYYWNAIKYIFRNPVDAGLTPKVESYKYSSLNHQSQSHPWKITDYFEDDQKELELDLGWLNQEFAGDQFEAVQKGLRRCVFQVPRNKNGHQTKLDAPQRKKELGT